MALIQAFRKVLHRSPVILILTVCFILPADSGEKTYSPKNSQEIEIISMVLASEAKANGWTKDDLICVSIDRKDPGKKLLKALNQLGLNVCRLSEWQKRFDCGFHVDLRLISFDPSQSARLHADTADVREINNGVAHIATRMREGEYSLRKDQDKWAIVDYVPSK
jgi:hypothetical protein